MFSKDGAFGKVRLANGQRYGSNLFSLSVCGWHRCNELYRIERKQNKDALLLYTVDGCGEMEIEGQRFSLPAGTVAYIPKNAQGYYRTPKHQIWEFYWVHPYGEAAHSLLSLLPRAAVKPSESIGSFAEAVERLLVLCTKNQPIELSRILGDLLHRTVALLYEKDATPTLSARAQEYFTINFSKGVGVEDAARALFVSTAHLIRVFKKETGITPHTYLTAKRLEYAKQLLSLGLSVGAVAAACGFCSASHFIGVFHRAYGITPAAFIRK